MICISKPTVNCKPTQLCCFKPDLLRAFLNCHILPILHLKMCYLQMKPLSKEYT